MALSAVLLRREEKVDKPVYYVSKVLQGAESRYPFAERVALALVMASRKLRPYFQAHPIVVLTDQPLRQIFQRPEYSGRLTKWAIEQGEYDICFEPRQAIKGHALADFIVECTGDEELNKADKYIWKMFVDGASSSSWNGAGVVLISPEGDILEYSLRFAYLSSNNTAEYEALIAGMSLAKQLQVKRLIAHSDSQLVVQQFLGEYEVKELIIRQYLHKVKTLSKEFEEFQLLQVNRNSNSHADALSKLASSMETKGRIVHLEELQRPSIEEKNIANIEDGNDWRIPFKKFLTDGELPSNTLEAKKLKMRAARFTLINDVLYKKVFSMPLLRCLHKQDAEYALAEVHEGICGQHMGARALAAKVLRAGFYWPTLRDDASKKVKKYDKCQRFAPIQKVPTSMFKSDIEPTPFAKWGLDLLGPFPQATGGRKFLMVATDYFIKWVEAEPLATITSKKIESMVWKDIIYRFGLPRILIADRGKQFDCDSYKDFCERLHIQLSFASVAYPQANGQAERSNQTILEGLKMRLDKAKGVWAEELPSILWAYRTTSKVSTGETPFNLTYIT
ncbi:uncharacterized protein LOC120277749 [Dioscorea cayenensis subsp. rotundata]|uniref:Uncharacterized protein LOC120277749 n=1 Tax=Dioscorea cayennensis subsp. rotundata TaxID=55577 RepID=A0AB40CKM1_DIOCR|nr:uncharacterized protein LOC120277749 [Dioscorea cayenensis subsp. rotundata]